MNEADSGTGLFLCRCGANIADFVDLESVASRMRDRDDVAFVETHDFLCSVAGKEFILETLKGKDVDNVILAACTPKMHLKGFQKTLGDAGVNIAKVHMANIREQCAWITKDRDKATKKARLLINAAIKRSAYHENLQQKTMECLTDVIVIGGGIAGIEAALVAANAGRKVTIIEKDISLGGSIIKIEEIAPNMECAPCLLAPRLTAVRENENIEVVANSEVTDVTGFFGNFTVKVRKKARYVDDSCIGCEACFEACPVSCPSDFHLGLGERKAIYTAFAGSVPASAVIDRERCLHFTDDSCSACAEACPFQSIDFSESDEELEFSGGAVILATGYDNPDSSLVRNLGYGDIDNVYTTPEFERIASSNGPTGGNIQDRRGNQPESVAVIHCAGSLSSGGLDYCSGICCMNALKVGELIRKQNPDAVVYNIHDRLVFRGPEEQSFYQKQIDDGTRMLKTDSHLSVSIKEKKGKIEISADGIDPVQVDMAVLSTGIVPSSGMEKLAEILHIDTSGGGFFKKDHTILHETGTTIDGINSAGCCVSPCSSSTAITRAYAAAGDSVSRLIPGRKLELEIMTAVIDEDLCAGCKLCISVCPYKAITFDPEKKISEVNEAICRGCGTCAASCPSGAASAKHFTNRQIYAEIEGVLNE
ncbi:MAG TPA: CoB--CoM heterodisulfide reductase iron-sulfur subunit A family protein [Candidatus Krumholzibacteriaceae bacterium]|nr:CoB--CoM heterodisulfide reductase iron-sulfur subunit A family protein [Candidatus Krumholzibacteriaceae bacterium]